MTDKSKNYSSTCLIEPVMTVLDIVSKYSATQEVFKHWDGRAGECICCNALFESLETVTEKYKLNLSALIEELTAAAEKDRGIACKKNSVLLSVSGQP
ncbi:hypothetical protein [uncultured Desulfobacter sp.]|uniref:hypothetical protein n=1 Tax=uncultured Desulfobacter sp. TaxID=240139 RepID=UPI002AAB7DA1|nr:hypothetical protein [uncultured Desulfobacter sp.]